MNASAAVRGLFWMPRAGLASRRIEAGDDAKRKCGWDIRVESIRNILCQSGYTVTQLSIASGRIYGNKSPYFIPATFLYLLRRGITPHVCQIAALSESTGYRFVDWLRIFGFDLWQIPRLQIRLHTQRTVLVTPMEDCFEPFMSEPFLGRDRGGSASMWSWLGEQGARRRYLFAKIGTDDAMASPKLLPGGIVRVDRYYAHRVGGLDQSSMSHLLWLVEQPGGLACSQVKWIDDRQIVLLPNRPPWGRWPLRLPNEARILGLVDIDVHPPRHMKVQAGAGATNLDQLFELHQKEERMKFSDLLRVSRGRVGLTFRAAHRLTHAIAQILGSREYGISLGMLSDYEATGGLPRHIAKILSLCVAYCVDIRELMAAAGVFIDDSAKLSLPMPDARLHLGPEFLESAEPRTHDNISAYGRAAGARS